MKEETNWQALATLPEHSVSLMQAISGGKACYLDNYLFYTTPDWLMAIAAPLGGQYNEAEFSQALKKAIEKYQPQRCFAMGHKLPAWLSRHISEKDRFYVLSCKAPVPAKLKNPVIKAQNKLTISESRVFTAQHRRLWSEFLQKNSHSMQDRVAALYARAPAALSSGGGDLRFLDAYDANGNLTASLLLDWSPHNFVSYILGAHSQRHYAPHASDALFATLLSYTKNSRYRFIHLGLGVNDGILRFKLKWGAVPSWNYLYAEWDTDLTPVNAISATNEYASAAKEITLALLRSPSISARQYLADEPEQKPYAMLWQLEKNGKYSWIGGTAHFFIHSFESSFKKLFNNVDNVLFEGPLDPEFMAAVDAAGKLGPNESSQLLHLLKNEELTRLEKTIFSSSLLQRNFIKKIDIRWLLGQSRPWRAFFTLWTTFLENQGWKQSVDMEAWRIAKDMGKNIVPMENLDEQLASLDSLPVERVLNFFRNCGQWKKMSRTNMHAYLNGDLEKMMGSSAEFPTRTEHVIGKRDQRFRERMRPWLEQGRTVVFVGSAHMVNLRYMLKDDGFKVRQAPFGIWPKLHLTWRNIFRPDERLSW